MAHPMMDTILSTLAAGQSGAGGGGMGQMLQMVQQAKAGGDTSGALKAMLNQKLEGVLAGLAPNDPKRGWITDMLAGKPVDKNAILAANPNLLANLQAKNPELAAMLIKKDPTLQAMAQGAVQGAPQGAAFQPSPLPQAPVAPPVVQVVAPAGAQEKLWGHLLKVGETADKAYQAALGAAQGAHQTSAEVQDLRGLVTQLLTAQQQTNDTLRNLPMAVVDIFTAPKPPAAG